MPTFDARKEYKHLYQPAAKSVTIERLHGFIKEHGYTLAGKHHEIYLSDPRRVAPERMKTVLRQPIRWGRPAESPVRKGPYGPPERAIRLCS